MNADPDDCEIQDLEIGDDGNCNFVKERRAELVGKEWAALSSANMTGMGVSTYDQLFDAQVRSSARAAVEVVHNCRGC